MQFVVVCAENAGQDSVITIPPRLLATKPKIPSLVGSNQRVNLKYCCSKSMATTSAIETAKKKAAAAAVDNHVMDGMVVGVGSGSTVVYVVERLIERVQTEHLKLIFIPSSFQSKQLISQGKLQLGDLDIYPEIDVTIDGADEIDHSLNLIKGGGGCQTQEKIIASNSKKFIIVADYRKKSQFLGEQWKKGVPVEVIPMAYVPLQKVIKER